MMKFFITGDCHRNFKKFQNIDKSFWNDQTAIIILGDVGLNIARSKEDSAVKSVLCKQYPFYFYCVRGNHEQRPQSVPNMKLIFDKEVDGLVWYQPEFPRIRYFMDYGEYYIGNLKTLVIGGAYSVDKYYRLGRSGLTEEYNDPSISLWFNDEQLSKEEMESAEYMFQYDSFDLVLTHTCPIDWQPIDLFLSGINRDKIDSSMEEWLSHLKNKIQWTVWLFGHYHADRYERPYVEQFFNSIEDVDIIYQKWCDYSFNKDISQFYDKDKSPFYYME